MIDASNCYYGTERATIKVSQLKARFFQEPQKVAVCANMQSAFDFYYRAHQAIQAFGARQYDSKVSAATRKIIGDVCWKMQKDLLAAADPGVSTYLVSGHLKWAFEHLQSTGNVWTDDGFNGWHGLTMPSSIVNFLEHVESAGQEVVTSYKDWNNTQNRIKEAKRNQQWDQLGTQIGYAKTAFETVTPKLWAWMGASAETASRAGEIGGKWLGYGGSLHNYASLYLKVRYNKDGAAQAALAEAAAFVVEKLPVFGSLYGEVIRGIPGLVTWFKGYAEQQRRAVNMDFR
ncbi:MAG: hypothetical protein JNL19_01870 [Burkholderiales bacterium]|nr:hypothetical protein [Burkholderiales bacterium]